ncbi:GNAT family N-acetyltransferase [Methylocapsa sp. S129]|uniref:GNAT family N-acetyltransferase n=1 Tax=Methylocapsa sp. S129 TaxID=1641869 RepID=UPI00131DA726|nr:GNAT family N-acetyltransferase [Methylocapsa sp. S129]
MTLTAPTPLTNRHDLSSFASNVAALDDWLKRRARANQVNGASRTFVVCEGDQVIGYYALASGGVNVSAATGRFRRNMPDPIPVAVLGRLAVDRRWQGKGIGRALFRDAALRLSNAAEIIGIRGVLVHAVSEDAKAFYLALGFDPSPLEPMTLMITLADINAALGGNA